MIITRETDYALRILRVLLDNQLHTVTEMSRTEQIPQQFAYKLLKKLSRAGYIEVLRGATGGCRLAVDLESVSLYDLIIAMDAGIELISCMNTSYTCEWRERHGHCEVHCQLACIQKKLADELRSHTLLEIITGKIETPQK